MVNLLIPQTIDFSVSYCTHSGRYSLAREASAGTCCQGIESECMQHFLLKVSDYSSADTGFQAIQLFPTVVAATLAPLAKPASLQLELPHPFNASPPGKLFRSILQLRN